MACFQQSGAGGVSPSLLSAPYRTEAECLQACKEGACCEGTTCTVKPQCQCQGAVQTFKGLGTVCTGSCDQCLGSESNCFCYCTSQGGKVPRFINVRVQYAVTGPPECETSVDQNVTLTFASPTYKDGVSSGGIVGCYYWVFSSPSLTVTAGSTLYNPVDGELMSVGASFTLCDFHRNWNGSLVSNFAKTTDSTGLCYRRHIGATVTHVLPNTGLITLTITILGMQE